MENTIETIEFIEARRYSLDSVEAVYQAYPSEEFFSVIWQQRADGGYSLSEALCADSELEVIINEALEDAVYISEFKENMQSVISEQGDEAVDELDDEDVPEGDDEDIPSASEHIWLYSAILGEFNADDAKNIEADLSVVEGSVVISPNNQRVQLTGGDYERYDVTMQLHIAPDVYNESTFINGAPFSHSPYAKKVLDKAVQAVVQGVYAKVQSNMKGSHDANPFESIDKPDAPDGLLVELCLAKGDADVIEYRLANVNDILMALNLPIEEDPDDINPAELDENRVRFDYEIALDILEVKDYFAVVDTSNELHLFAKEAPLEGQRYYSTHQETVEEVSSFFDMCRMADKIKQQAVGR